MEQELKDKWIAALRSGKYKQGVGLLHDRNHRFCCLGVLCEVAGIKAERVQDHDAQFMGLTPDQKGCYQYEGEMGFLHRKTLQKFGLLASDASILAEKNDNGYSFGQLADLIKDRV